MEKNRKGTSISNISPQYCDLTSSGEIIFLNYENNTLQRVNPANRQLDKEVLAEGTKKGLTGFNNYGIVVTTHQLSTKTSMNMNIYDITNEYIAYTGNFNQVRAVIPAINSVFVAVAPAADRDVELFEIREMSNSDKLEKFFKKNSFDLAYKFAKSNNYDESLLAEISRVHGDHFHSKGGYEGAIKQYIQTIGYLEPSYVIRKFLDVSQIEFLISYLEELHNHPNKLANHHHTALLLNCFVKQKSIEKLKEWMTRVSTSSNKNNNEYTETAVKVCMDLDQTALAKDFAKRCKHHELYLRILIESKSESKGADGDGKQAEKDDCLTAIEYIK